MDVFFAVAHIYIFMGPGVPWNIVRQLLNLDIEVALTTWFATVQLFAIGAVFLLAARANKKEDSLSTLLALGGLFFLFLSADEGGGIHERISLIIETRGFDSLLFPGNRGGWILAYAVGGIIFSLTAGFYVRRSLKMLWQRFARESLIILGGFGSIVLGAVGFEIITFLLPPSGSLADLYHLEVAIEEFLEMTGASAILYAALKIAATLCPEESVDAS